MDNRIEYNLTAYKKSIQEGKEKKAILFMGFDYRYTGNSRYLFEELLKKRTEDLYFVTTDEKVDKKYRIEPESKEMYEIFYQSKIIVFETWTEKTWIKSKDTVWIQLWHGSPLKRMLLDSDEAEIAKVNPWHQIEKLIEINKWDYFLIDNENIYPYFKSSCLLEKDKVLDYGYPRVKYLIENKNNEQLKQEIKRKAGIPEDKKVILYLPTWRDYNYGRSEEEIDYDYFPNMDKIKSTVGNDYVIVSKNHVFLNNKNKDSITNVTTETQELLLIGDYLISDYSSVIFDAFAIDLPVVLLANDFEKYQKSRGVYETPGGAILYHAHEVLETITIDKETARMKQYIGIKFADIVYNGQWYTPLREALSAFVTETQKTVTGDVKLKLYKGNIINAGVTSPYTLYSEDFASFGEDDVYDQTDAKGFINLFGLPIKVKALLDAERNNK